MIDKGNTKRGRVLTEQEILDNSVLVDRIKNAKANTPMSAEEMKAWLASLL